MCRILLVEDELIEREAFKIIVKDAFKDIDISEAANSEDAFKLLETKTFDLIFMDIKIPGISGLDLSKHIKDNYPDYSIVITTAHNEFEFAHKAIKIHVDDFLLKPIRKEKIIEMIETYGINKSKKPSKRHDNFINEIKNNLIGNDYLEAVANARELIESVYGSNAGDMQKNWEMVVNASNQIYDTVTTLTIDSFKTIDKNMYNLKSNRKIYSSKFLITEALIELLRSIFSELLINKNGFYGNVNDIAAYIEINIRNNISLEEVSNHYNISSYYMSKIFKKEMGVKFIDFVTNKKMELAKDLLEHTDNNIINIAIDLGYSEPNYFSKVFKKNVGISPSKYRHSKRAAKES